MAYTTINKGSSYFNTVLYAGSSSTQSITGVGFRPDWVWIKNRTSTPDHVLQDVVRGANNYVRSNSTAAELNRTYFQSFDANGFSLEGAVSDFSASGSNYVSWNWLAGNTSGSSNTSGTITSTVTTNQTAGFSILTYTGNGTSGATVGHGLGTTPACYIVKCRNTGGTNWSMYHQSLGNTKAMVFTATAERTSSVYWNNTSPTSTVFSLGNDNDVNVNTQTYVAYCFAEIKGYSKFGSYTGNNTNDGPFVYTGFKPAFILIKPSNGAYNWTIIDNKRNPYNVTTLGLIPNTTSADTTGAGSTYNMDILSNGFKPRYSSVELNGSLTYIYMAFAENPFVTSGGIPTTAR